MVVLQWQAPFWSWGNLLQEVMTRGEASDAEADVFLELAQELLLVYVSRGCHFLGRVCRGDSIHSGQHYPQLSARYSENAP